MVSNPLGGIRSYLLYNLPFLEESGYVFTFLAPEGPAFDSFVEDVKDRPGVEFIGAPTRNRRARLRAAVREALRTRRFALVHSQGLRAGTEACLANLGLGVPHVVTLHDVIVPQNDIPGRLRWFKKIAIGHITARARTIVAVSRDCAENHLAHFPQWRRGRCEVAVILNGIDVGRLRSAAAAVGRGTLRDDLGVADGVRLLGFFGRFMPQKGFFVLLDALRQLAGAGLGERVRLVATKDPHGYRGEYIRTAERDPVLASMVKFVEPVQNIATVLPQVDVLVMPSLWEACPLLPMEAMVLGIPVVGSDCIGLREVLRETPSAAPRAGDPAALAAAIVEALEPSVKKAAKDFASEAQKRFDIRRGAEALRGIYDSAAAEGIRSRV